MILKSVINDLILILILASLAPAQTQVGTVAIASSATATAYTGPTTDPFKLICTLTPKIYNLIPQVTFYCYFPNQSNKTLTSGTTYAVPTLDPGNEMIIQIHPTNITPVYTNIISWMIKMDGSYVITANGVSKTGTVVP